MSDLISRKAEIDALGERPIVWTDDDQYTLGERNQYDIDRLVIETLPSTQSEPLTDKEQRIFLAAMAREEKVCEEVDRKYVHEPYEDSLMSVCKAIRRKVKDTLWT